MADVYTTVQGDMWDYIAFKVYGSETYTPMLMEVNPEHAKTVIFSADIRLAVPPVAVPTAVNLPPWKRRQAT